MLRRLDQADKTQLNKNFELLWRLDFDNNSSSDGTATFTRT